MTRDQELVRRIQQRWRDWKPDEVCRYHSGKRCRFDEQGRLTRLHLCGLRLEHIPAEIWQCSALQGLYLMNNQLSTLPLEVGQLSQLQWLDLDNNQLSTLPPEVGQLSSLHSLDLSNNQLSTLPPEVGQLSQLQEFGLSNNQLSTLSPEVGQLTSLHSLTLSGNQLKTLSAVVDQLSQLRKLTLSGNPLQIPPPEIVAQGIAAILAYLRTLQQATIERFEAKMILVGEAGMGKTSLLCSLREEPFAQDRPATPGIEVGALRVAHPTRQEQEITLYTWILVDRRSIGPYMNCF